MIKSCSLIFPSFFPNSNTMFYLFDWDWAHIFLELHFKKQLPLYYSSLVLRSGSGQKAHCYIHQLHKLTQKPGQLRTYTVISISQHPGLLGSISEKAHLINNAGSRSHLHQQLGWLRLRRWSTWTYLSLVTFMEPRLHSSYKWKIVLSLLIRRC